MVERSRKTGTSKELTLDERIQRASAMFERFDREVSDKINHAWGVIVSDGLGRLWTIKSSVTPFGEVRTLEISSPNVGSDGMQYQVLLVQDENGKAEAAAYVKDWERKKYRPQDVWFHDNNATAFTMMERKVDELLPATSSGSVELTTDVPQEV